MTKTAIIASRIGRTRGDCLRLATVLAWGGRYGFDYDDTPAIDSTAFTGWAQQRRAWDTWAAARGLGWWLSLELAPVGAARWIAIVDSPGGPASHAVVMSRDRLYACPTNHYERIVNSDVRAALLLVALRKRPAPLRGVRLSRPWTA